MSSTKYTHRVFFRQLTNAQRDQLNIEGWSGEIGTAYMDAEGGFKPANYEGAIRLQLYEMATQVQAESLDEVWNTVQNLDEPWSLRNPKFTSFPRSMSVGDIIYDRVADKFFAVANFGFNEVTDPAMIAHLKEM